MLEFEVLNLERPDWTRDEIILACALAESNGWRQVYDTDERAKELSQLLQSPAIHPLPRHPDFRNPAGVGQKTRTLSTSTLITAAREATAITSMKRC